MAEIELSVLARQCLDRRIPDRDSAGPGGGGVGGEAERGGVKADWQFTTADARVKLKKLYPTIQLQ